MSKKAFFRERTPAEIRRLDVQKRQYDLVKRILELDAAGEAVLINAQLIPGRFFIRAKNAAEAGRKAYKHGEYVPLNQARALGDALDETRLPHEMRRETLDRTLGSKREQEIEAIGYSFRPVQGRDRRKRLVPFAWILEGARIFAYAMQSAGGISVFSYEGAQIVEKEGANIVVKVPAREEKKERYNIRLESIPTLDTPSKHAISLGFNSTYAEGKVPEHSLWSFGYKFKDDQEQSRAVIFYPHDVAGELAATRHFLLNDENTIPWDMNPFAKPSRLAVNFYRKLCNNVLIVDPSVKEKDKSRKLYIPEKSILLARLIGKLGHDETMFWKPKRDAKLQDYDWSIPTTT